MSNPHRRAKASWRPHSQPDRWDSSSVDLSTLHNCPRQPTSTKSIHLRIYTKAGNKVTGTLSPRLIPSDCTIYRWCNYHNHNQRNRHTKVANKDARLAGEKPSSNKPSRFIFSLILLVLRMGVHIPLALTVTLSHHLPGKPPSWSLILVSLLVITRSDIILIFHNSLGSQAASSTLY